MSKDSTCMGYFGYRNSTPLYTALTNILFSGLHHSRDGGGIPVEMIKWKMYSFHSASQKQSSYSTHVFENNLENASSIKTHSQAQFGPKCIAI